MCWFVKNSSWELTNDNDQLPNAGHASQPVTMESDDSRACQLWSKHQLSTASASQEHGSWCGEAGPGPAASVGFSSESAACLVNDWGVAANNT